MIILLLAFKNLIKFLIKMEVQLPDEVLFNIMLYLDNKSLRRIGIINSNANQIYNDPYFWEIKNLIDNNYISEETPYYNLETPYNLDNYVLPKRNGDHDNYDIYADDYIWKSSNISEQELNDELDEIAYNISLFKI